MTGADIRRRREALGLSAHDLAGRLGEHGDQLTAWESIGGSLPGKLGRRLDFVLAVEEREAALLRAGAPPCPQAESLADSVHKARNVESVQSSLAGLQTHTQGCPVCQRRLEVVDTLPPLPPAPLPGWVSLLGALQTAIGRFPAPLRAGAWGALLIGAIAVARGLLALALQPAARNWGTIGTILGAVAIGAYAGTVGGLAYHFLRPRLRRFGRPGDYLTGIGIVYAYLVALGVPFAIFTAEDMFRSTLGWIILLIVGALGGSIIGHTWFRHD